MKKNRKISKVLAGVLMIGALGVLPYAYSAADKTYEQLKILVDILTYIRDNYVEEADTKKLIYGAAHGMVRTLDPFSQFMDPDAHKEIKTETEGQFGGLGIRIGLRDNWLTVITPMPGTPAYKAGILPGDRIIKINDESTQDAVLYDAVKKLRGSPGTKVTITVARAPNSQGSTAPWTTQDFTLVREIVKIETIQSRLLDEPAGIGYLRIIEFNAHTSEDVARHLKDLGKKGLQALVLDLRNNPGGLLSGAVEVAQDFLGDGKLIVYTQGRRSENHQEFRASSKALYQDLPLVVLVNKGSASGSEIVAGALQDNRRAIVIGSRTFGKASVQSVIPLQDGSGLRLTVAKYYTPSGKAIQRDEKGTTGGIEPDISIQVSWETEVKLQTQFDEIYSPGKDPVLSTKKEDRVKDEILDRAVELLKARDVLATLKPPKG